MPIRVIALVLLPLWLALTACASTPDPRAVPILAHGNTIWLVYRDWHTSVLIDGDAFWRLSRHVQRAPQLELELHSARVVRVGWGDGDYFTGKSKSAGTATLALLASGYSALQFIGYSGDPLPSIAADTRVALTISDAGLAALVAYIDNSLETDAAGALHNLPSYVDNAGVFFVSNQHYGLLNNCNTWTSEALRSAGLPIRGALWLGPRGIFEQARLIAAVQTAANASVAEP